MTENWSEVGVVGAEDFAVVAEGDFQWVPRLCSQIELSDGGWVYDGDVRPRVGDTEQRMSGESGGEYGGWRGCA